MRQNQRKITPNKETLIIANGHASSMHISQNSAEWEEIDFETVVREPEKTTKTHTTKRSFEVGASRPSPGSIGKLKLSSEMRQRLEQVTANHSVRSTSSKIDKPARIVNKLEDTRKMMLEQQLTGRWGSESADDNNESSGPPSPVTPAQVRAQLESKSPTQQSWTSSTWKPGPPPPPIGPSSLPPAPSMPAPPPPVRPQQQPPPPIEPIRESFMAQRQDRDTFGVHQNRTVMNNSKRNSFSANWDIQSSVTQETQDDGTSWSKDFDEKQERHARDSWDQPDSTVPSIEVNRKAMILMNDRWDSEKSFDKKNVMQEPAERPTFRSHQFSKSASRDREKKHSVSTQNTEKIEKMEVQEWPEFMRPIQTPPPSKSPILPTPTKIPKEHSPITTPKLLPLGTAACITYNRVSWLLRVRKEVFTPAEPLGPPAALHLIAPAEPLGPPAALHLVFCQIVSDVYGVTACIRLTQNEKRAGISMLSGYGITAENFNSPHRANIKRNVVELARTWPLYFARLFQVSGAAQLSDVQLLAVSHWGIHLVKKENNLLQVIKSYSLGDVASCTAPRPTTLCIESPGGRLTLHATRAQQLSEMVTKFCNENKKEIRTPTELSVNRFKTTSLDSLANSSNNSESLSDDSEGESKSFAVKCEVYGQSTCGSIRSWNRSESSNSEGCYDYVTNDCSERKTLPVDKKSELNGVRMETIPEENWCEPKVSVKEILARFENLKDTSNKDYNNNNNQHHKNNNNNNKFENLKDTSNKDYNNNNNQHHKNNNNNNNDVIVSNNNNNHNNQNLGIAMTHSVTNNVAAPALASPIIPASSLSAKLSTSTISSSSPNGNNQQNGQINHTHICNNKKSTVTSTISSSSPNGNNQQNGQINHTHICNNKKSTVSEISAAPNNSVKAPNTQTTKEIQLKSSPPPRVPPVERIEAITNNVSPMQEPTARPSRREHGAQSPSSPPPSTGKYSLLQFAMHHFRNSSE
ncbi:hypothetical protein QE152_g9077 [Popillia japonica]|uniref:Unconventional myosin-XV-like domain-containing protein n=1 Tax=Popillia japonica TaxID=7064 RepID=A0AAW1LVY0_POPJA